MSKKIISPCISICKTDPVTGYCYGCARTNEEKKQWKDENISDEWKLANIEKRDALKYDANLQQLHSC